MFYHKWVGLPWRRKADPRTDRAACCFRTAQAVRECLGLPWPAECMDDWYRTAEQGLWPVLRRDWDRRTTMIEGGDGDREPGDLLMFDSTQNDSFGIGVFVTPQAFITVPEGRRLIVLPAYLAKAGKLYVLDA